MAVSRSGCRFERTDISGRSRLNRADSVSRGDHQRLWAFGGIASRAANASMTKTAAIADAIERKRMLRLDDHGKSRTVIPHILGLAGTGNLALKGFSRP
jgi:hypothetical protein